MDSPMPDSRSYARALRLVFSTLLVWLRLPARQRPGEDARSRMNSRMQAR